VLATINKKCFRDKDSDAWRGLPAHHDHPPWSVAVVVVANEQGFQALHSDLDYAAFKTDLEASIGGIKDPKCRDAGVVTHIDVHLDRVALLHAAQQWQLRVPDKFQRLPAELAGDLAPSTEGVDPALFHAAHKLLIDWRQVVYTDGSVAGGSKDDPDAATLVGAGIYKPGSEGMEPATIMLDLASAGMTNTINRAELAPILYALQNNVGCTVATDSACNLYQIARYICDLSGMERHTHRPLLELIASEILERCRAGQPVHLIKVSAHSGIVGNEMADELAKAAGSRSADGGPSEEVMICPAPAETPMHKLYWPVYEHGAARSEKGPQLRHVQNLKNT
jgi:ribonuclease HI